jgi:uncharacterized protein
MNSDQHGKQRFDYRRRALRFLRFIVVAYVVVVLFMALNETRLVYPGRPPTIGNWKPSFKFEAIAFESADGTELEGWLLPYPDAKRAVLLFHGNAENVATTSAGYGNMLRTVLQADVFVYDYRGFGNSHGTPHEQGLIDDGIAAVDWLSNRTDKPANEIIFYGSSLGGGVAIGVAESRPPKMLLLDRTFDSLVGAAGDNYPWLPVRWIMRNRYPSADRLARLDIPVFISHFRNDELVSIERSRRLFAASPSDAKQFLEMDSGGHLAPLPFSYWEELHKFVSALDSINIGASNEE